MATHVGIELSPAACRVIEIAGDRDAIDARVVFYAEVPSTSLSTQGRLSLLRGRHATVVVWAATTAHQVVAVSPGRYERMHADARAAVRMAGGHTWRTLTDIAPVSEIGDQPKSNRPVVMASAAAAEVSAMLEPLVTAGVAIDSVMTPAAALLSLARARRVPGMDGAVEAYIALDEHVVSIALIRNGALIAAVDRPWGFVEERSDGRFLRSREEIVNGLELALKGLWAECRIARASLQQICICGGLPELRSTAMALMVRVDVEVEPLDSLFGIDSVSLPGPDGDFRERVAGLRLAWAAAAESYPQLDLLRAGRRRAQAANFSRAAIAAGIATGVIVGSQVASSVANVGHQTAAHSRPLIAPRVPTLPPRPAKTSALPTTDSVEAPTAIGTTLQTGPAVSAEPVTEVPASRTKSTSASLLGQRKSGAESNGAPFTATVQGILYASDRAFALVDGRIVQPGDVVRDGTVAEIRPTSVVFRDAAGRLHVVTSSITGR